MEGFTDATALIRPGVYLLLRQGKVVFVGKGDRQMLSKIATHRSLTRKSVPDWFPVKGITFDQVFIRTVHPDRLEAEYLSLILEHNPHHNLPAPAFTSNVTTIPRRI
jgi:hypothetical protein